MKEFLLRVENFSAVFLSNGRQMRAVDDLSFSLEKGQVLGIVGESGSGKSVTSLALMGLLPPAPLCSISGKALLHPESDGKDLFSLSEREKQKVRGREISMIFQEPMTSLNPVYRCGRQVTEALRLHLGFGKKEAKEQALSWFSEVKLQDPEKVFRAYPHELSGGQKQRVMIAMAMSCRPSLLIADEPTTALDVSVQKSILDLMRELQQKFGMSMIFISHDLGVVSSVADRVLVMYRGKMVEEGRAGEVFSNPSHPYTRGLLACRPPVSGRPLRLPVVEDFLLGKEISVAAEDKDARFDRHAQMYNGQPLLNGEKIMTRFALARSLSGKVRRWFTAVQAVDISIYPGETLGLVGESGSGKTTLGRTLIRLTDASSGKILFQGKDITAMKGNALRKLRRDMQIVFQDPYSSLNPRMTAGDAVMEPMRVHLRISRKECRKRALALFDKTGLGEEFFNRYPHEFSGGQRQRVCIARALALNPRFVVCDESVSALDVSVQAQVLNLLNDLKKEFGLTYIFISHDLSVVRYMSDRIFVMKDGKIAEYGEADTVFFKPQHEYTQKLISSLATRP